jgi:HSF-type DNA-binding
LKKTRKNPDASQQQQSGDIGKATAGTEERLVAARSSYAMASCAMPVPETIAAASKRPYDPAAAKGGPRIRLPDKLIEYLNNRVETDVLWWQPDGDGFAFDSAKVQTGFLDKHFEGTKLKSFIRSLNRW